MFSSRKAAISVVLVLTILLISGCIRDINNNSENPADSITVGEDLGNYSLDSMVMVGRIPEGYEYLGSLEISNYNKFSEKIIESREGAYRDRDNFDVFLDIIKLDSKSSAVEFISNYKSQYEQLSTGDRFTTTVFNGHDATRIKTYTLRDGIQLPKYQIIWNNENIVFIVRSNSNLESSAMELAKATGY